MQKIIIIFPNSFPISGAATNRIISLSRGLVEFGNNVKIIITRPTEKKESQINFNRKGRYKGILFEYATKEIIWPENKIYRFLYLQIGILSTCRKILIENQKGKINTLISASTYGFFENIIYSLLSKLIKVKFIHTIDEYPWVIINKDQYPKLYSWFYLKYYYRLFDGFLVITKTLIDYYKKISSPRATFIHIPMTVEIERFNINNKKTNEKYIAYAGGDISGTKDGVDILVKSFNKIKNNYPDLKLYIIGNVNQSIYNLVELFNLSNRVIFIGFVKRDRIPGLLNNAMALCLARPNNIQAEGGFPTKLGEYLASGSPVIVTNVGEISIYLKDKINAFVAKPNDIEDFARKINEVFSNYDKAKKIGENGRILAQKVFSFKIQGKRLNDYLDKLNEIN